MAAELPIHLFADPDALEAWLEANHEGSDGLWANPAAAECFASLDSANRYAIFYRLDEAKRPETRERRLRKFVAMLERGEKIHR